MKKTLLVSCLLLATSSMSFAAGQGQMQPQNAHGRYQNQEMQRPLRRPNFDEKLNLTEAQKEKARVIRQQGHAQMRPIFEQLHSKMDQKRLLMQNKNAGVKEAQELAKLNNEIYALKNQADAIRDKNHKQFEAILTDSQKRTFEKIKREGRKKFEKKHRPSMSPQGRDGMGKRQWRYF